MEQRKKTNDGKMDGWRMDETVKEVKDQYENNKNTDTQEIKKDNNSK